MAHGDIIGQVTSIYIIYTHASIVSIDIN